MQSSRYVRTDQKEWVAENFTTYMMGRRKLVDTAMTDLVEDVLSE